MVARLKPVSVVSFAKLCGGSLVRELVAAFFLVFAEMDSVEAFDKMLSDLSVVEGVRAKLKERGYTTAAGLYWALEAGAETTFQHVLEAASV